MKNAVIILALMFFYVTLSIGQNNILTPSIQDFAPLQGNWTGVLEYTDYQDDKTKVQLKTTRTYGILDKNLFIQTTYIEPNGVPVYNKGTASVSKKGDKINFDGSLFVLSEKSEGRLVLTQTNEDNNKKSEIREIFNYTNEQLTITKEVKYEGTNAFFMRHQYRFQRESADSLQERLFSAAQGRWELDLRPSPQAAAYLKDFTIQSFTDGQLSGEFYGTAFKGGKTHTAWGKFYFSFTTSDQSGTYFHSGYLEEGQLYGTSFSEGRGFMVPWFSTKKK